VMREARSADEAPSFSHPSSDGVVVYWPQTA
jgi:bacterioferritin-associated ferredoxin